MHTKPSVFAIFAMILSLSSLAACASGSVDSNNAILPMSTQINSYCEACDQATLAAARTEEKIGTDARAAATAEVLRANAQSTMNAANATLSAARTQEKFNADVIAAQMAATAEIVRANAQATLVAAGSTQSAALAADAIRQTQVQYDLQSTQVMSTQNAAAMQTQQNKNDLAAGTQTAVADVIATQTQSALATTQGYANQARQRNEERQGPLTLMMLWCIPILVLGVLIISLMFFWRWMKIRETQLQLNLEAESERLRLNQASMTIDHEPRISDSLSNTQYRLAKPRDHVRRWLAEVKRNLLANKEKDDDDNPVN